MKNKTKAMSFKKDKIKTIKKKVSPSKNPFLSKKSKKTIKNKPVLKSSATLRKHGKEAAEKTSREWQATFDAVNDAICLLDVDNHIIRCNRSMNEIFGITQEELTERHCWEIVHGTSEPIPDCPVTKIKSSLQREETEIQIKEKWLNIIAYPILNDNHVLITIVHIIRDITDRKKTEKALLESEYKYKSLIENIPDIIFTIDLEGKITFISKRAKEISGYENAEMINKNIFNFIPEEAHQDTIEKLQRGIQGEKIKHVQMPVTAKSGEKLFFEFSFSRIYKDGAVVGAQGTAVDITERKKAEDELRESEHRYHELSIIDDLTQLFNSRHFYAQLEREMERSNRYDQPLALLMLDLDKFKDFNDTYGHIEGDQVLSRIGQVVKRCLRETDSAYRYGGEEFTIMLPMTTSEEGIVIAKRIQTELRKEAFFPVLGQEVYMTVSIGLAQYKPKEEMKAFVQQVDQLMYQAKKNGRDRICPES
jgi:diguanylate cyclase (GGDEF)-like protein/PAS domain S-box-containing protein